MLARYEYDVFGAVRSETGTSDNARKFTGKEYESDVKLYYYGARYYDPYAGRFISRDPAGQGVNWYLYTDNNPLAFIDPTGLASRAPNKTEMGRLRAAAVFTFGQSNADILMSNLPGITLTEGVLHGNPAHRGFYNPATRTIEIQIHDVGETYFDPASDMRRLGTFIHELEHFRQALANVPNPKDNLPDPNNIYSQTSEQLINLTFGREPMARAVQDWFKVMYREHLGLWPDTPAGFRYHAGAAFEWYGALGLSTPTQLVYIADYYYSNLINAIRDPLKKHTTWGAIK